MLTTALLLQGCSPALYVPTSADVQPGTSLAMLQLGRQVYAERCGSCHRLHAPDSHRPEEWPALVQRMHQRARLDSVQQAAVLAFLRLASRATE